MIKAKRVPAVRDLLRTQEFHDWYLRFETVRRDLKDIEAHDPERLVHSVLRAGEYEDLSAQAEATYSNLDTSFETLSAFEQQRTITSETWQNLGSVEHELTEHRQAAGELKARLAATQKNKPSATAEHGRIQGELVAEKRLVKELSAEATRLQESLAAETQKRDTLWQVVEDAWLQAFRANMARIEYSFLARQAREEVEALSREGNSVASELSPEEYAATEEERTSLRDEFNQLLAQAEDKFGAVAIEQFLYWPHENDIRSALCVPLVDELNLLNIQVTRLSIYRIERAKGLRFIEPLPFDRDGTPEDTRLDSFFQGRPG